MFWLFIDLSLGGSVSICNGLQTQWTSTGLVCDSSVLHTGTPSSCSTGSGRYGDNTVRHATRIGSFPKLSAVNQWTVVMVVGGGTWTAGPWDGGPSNSGKKQWKPGARFFSLWICTIWGICILQYAEYAQYASIKICTICMIICKIICMQ